MLRAFLDHRRDVLLRRSRHRLAKIDARLEILEGFLVAYLNLDRVIEIIRTEDDPKAQLVAALAGELGGDKRSAGAMLDALTGIINGIDELRTLVVNLRTASDQLNTTLKTTDRAVADIDRELVQQLPPLVRKLDSTLSRLDSAAGGADTIA